jgi:hypothetical protein
MVKQRVLKNKNRHSTLIQTSMKAELRFVGRIQIRSGSPRGLTITIIFAKIELHFDLIFLDLIFAGDAPMKGERPTGLPGTTIAYFRTQVKFYYRVILLILVALEAIGIMGCELSGIPEEYEAAVRLSTDSVYVRYSQYREYFLLTKYKRAFFAR